MPSKSKKFYLTTPIYYVNSAPHLGHAYTTIAADVLARYHRLIGDETFFLTGTDEHGAKIEVKARESGLEPQEFVNQISAKFQLAWDELNISNDNFIRTTEKQHQAAVKQVLAYLYKKGDIYQGSYEGLYCRECEQFKNERDLINGLCPDHKIKPERVVEESYLFKLSKYQTELLKQIKSGRLEIRPEERKNEIISFYEKEGLEDISFSRKNVKWGIPLPWDKEHTAYVWADAFLNYLTGLGWSGPGQKISKLWPPDVQLMSKDILRVHATIWPAMLLALDLPLPKLLFVHGFFLVEGQKMSKSIGNVIAPEDLIKRYGVDGSRYLLLSVTPFGHDGDIGWGKLDEKYNADLANGLGNLSRRILTLVEKSGIQNLSYEQAREGSYETILKQFKEVLARTWQNYESAMDQLEFHLALEAIWNLIAYCDEYLEKEKPWELISDLAEGKEEVAGEKVGEQEIQDELEIILFNLVEALRQLSWLIWPFLPETTEEILGQLDIFDLEKNKSLEQAKLWPNEWSGQIKRGRALFPRIEEAK